MPREPWLWQSGHSQEDKCQWTKVWNIKFLRSPLTYCLRQKLQTFSIVQNWPNNSFSCKVEADMGWQDHFTPLQDETYRLPYHLNILVCSRHGCWLLKWRTKPNPNKGSWISITWITFLMKRFTTKIIKLLNSFSLKLRSDCWDGKDMSFFRQTLLRKYCKLNKKAGRQKKRWADNIKECTGLNFHLREQWIMGILIISSKIPPQMARLWDK